MNETSQPLPHLDYVPVGRAYTQQQIGNLSLREVQNRTVYDPRYAGFDDTFQWQDYVRLDIRDPQLRHQVEASLEQFGRTPEGQHLLRQSLAMETFRRTDQIHPANIHFPEFRVKITDYRTNRRGQKIRFSGIDEPSSWFNGTIALNKDELKTQYLGVDDRYHPESIQDTLYHELSHSADGFLTNRHEAFWEVTHAVPLERTRIAMEATAHGLKDHGAPRAALAAFWKRADKKLDSAGILFADSYLEYPAIRAASEFMAKYYREPLEAIRYDAEACQKDPRAGDSHFHDSILLPPMDTPRDTASRKVQVISQR